MESLEEQIAALNAALEAGDFSRATEVLRACDPAQLVKSRSVSPTLRGMIERALETARRAQAQREAELARLSQLEQAQGQPLGQAQAQPLEHRVAAPADRALVIALLGELFDEIAPGEVAARSKRFLEADVERALASPTVRIFLASWGSEPIGLARVDLLDTSPAFPAARGSPLRLHRSNVRAEAVPQAQARPPLAAALRGVGPRPGRRALHAARGGPGAGFYAGLGYLPTRELFKKL